MKKVLSKETVVRILSYKHFLLVFFVYWIRSDEGLTLETSAFRISVRWPINFINSVKKKKQIEVNNGSFEVELQLFSKS